MKSRWARLLRDLFLGGLALAILYDQVFLTSHAQSILIFLVIFLFGSIPALRGDQSPGHYSTFARVVMMVLGVAFPENWDEVDEGRTPSQGDFPTHSGGPRSARRHSASRKSSSRSTKDDE
jgi:hypothetical protein